MNNYCTKCGQKINNNYNKKDWKTICLIIAVIIIIFLLYPMINKFSELKDIHDNYASMINANWHFDLPECDEKIYYIDENSNSIFGDGDRYSILKYTDETKLNELSLLTNWKGTLLDEDKIMAEHILEELNVPKDKQIDFNKNLLYMTSTKGSFSDQIILIYDNEKNLLYVFEHFI